MSDLFIPKKIRVGFQKREGTYTGKLAYVIYYDAKNKIRKEKSWLSWRDEKIKTVELDNTPTADFHLNKGIQRFNWSHFGSNRSYIRIFDSRGIEFEITPENLIGILTETNCSKRGLEGEFVYAWKGAELVLLPCCSAEYQEAVKYTDLQGQKISARDLKAGCSYTTKKGEEVIYMGRFSWFKWDSHTMKTRISQKKHIFASIASKSHSGKFFPKSDASFLAVLNSPDPVDNYAELVDKWNGNFRSSVIDSWKNRPLKPKIKVVFKDGETRYGEPTLKRNTYTKMQGNVVTFFSLMKVLKYSHAGESKIKGYRLLRSGQLDLRTMTYKNDSEHGYHYYSDYMYDSAHDNKKSFSQDEIVKQLADCVEVDLVLSSGKKLHLRDIRTLHQN